MYFEIHLINSHMDNNKIVRIDSIEIWIIVINVDTFTNKKDLALTLQGISTTVPVPMIILD